VQDSFGVNEYLVKANLQRGLTPRGDADASALEDQDSVYSYKDEFLGVNPSRADMRWWWTPVGENETRKCEQWWRL